MKKNIFLIKYLLLFQLVMAQSPGGVSTTNLKAWYKADAYTSQPTGWPDASSNGKNLTAGSATPPTWTLNSSLSAFFNFNPYFSFNGNNGNYFYSVANIMSGNTTAGTIFNVVRSNDTAGGNWRTISGFGDDNPNLQHNSSNQYNVWRGGSNIGTIGTNVHAMPTNIPNMFWNSSGGNQIQLNGTYTSTSTGGGNITNNLFAIGSEGYGIPGNGSERYIGGIPEVIVFDINLASTNEAQRINSYLSMKYGVTMAAGVNYLNSSSTSSSTGVVWDATANSAYHNNVATIIKDVASALHQKQSRSVNTNQKLIIGAGTGLFETNQANTNTLSNLQSLTWGDNGLAQSLNTSLLHLTAPGGKVNNRFGAIWKVQNTGSVGTVTVAWPAEITNLHLVRSTDATFDATDDFISMTGTTTVNGVTYNTATINFNDGDYFTFAGFIVAPGGIPLGLRTWFKADAGVYSDAAGTTSATNGGDVRNWTDQTGNNYNLNVVGGTAPKLHNTTADKLINFNPTLVFSAGGGLNRNGVLFANTSPYTFGGVTIDEKTNNGYGTFFNSSTTYNAFCIHKALSSTSRNGWNFHDAGGNYSYVNGATNNTLVGGNGFSPSGGSNGTWNGSNYSANISTQPQSFVLTDANSTGSTQSLTLDGYKSVTTGMGTGSRSNWFNGLSIGDQYNGTSSYTPYTGRIPEFFAYSQNLSDADIQKINTYLAIKYGTTLGQGGANASTNINRNHNNYNYVSTTGGIVWDATANATYNANIAGIAKDDNTALYQKQSRSSVEGQKLIIGIGTTLANTNSANTNTLTEGQYLIWGDNGLAQNFGEQLLYETAPGGKVNNRFGAIWKVQETNAVGTVIVAWPAGITNFHLIRSTDATFDTTDEWLPMTGTTTINGVTYNTAIIDFNDGDFFTFAGWAVGPGGVKPGEVKFWYKAESLNSLPDGSSVTEWTDSSHNGYNITQGTAARQPKFYNSTSSAKLMNYNPVVYFGTSAYTFLNNTTSFAPQNGAYALFGVAQNYATDTNWRTILCTARPSIGQEVGEVTWRNQANGWVWQVGATNYVMTNGNNTDNGAGGNSFSPSGGINKTFNGSTYVANNSGAQPQVFGIQDVAYTGVSPIGLQHTSFIDGYKATNTAAVNTSRRAEMNTGLTLGWGITDTGEYIIGSIPEIVGYSTTLSDEEARKVNTYLAIKYGTTLGQGGVGASTNINKNHNNYNYVSSLGYIIWDASTSTNHNYNIFGIAKDDTSLLDQKVSKSSNPNTILKVATINDFVSPNSDVARTSLSDNQFLLIGDNNNTSTTTILLDPNSCPALAGTEKRIARTWLVQNYGEVESKWYQIDLNSYDINSDVFLLIGDGVDGSGNITGNVYSIPGSYSSGIATFYGSIPDKKYFTVAGNVVAAPCATCSGGSVTLKQASSWNTAAKRLANNTGSFNVGTPVASGQITATNTVVYTGAVETSSTSSYPQPYSSWARLARTDNKTGSANNVVYTTQLNVASKASFRIRGINNSYSKSQVVVVKGYCGGSTVLPILDYEEKNPIYRNLTISGNTATGTKAGSTESTRSGIFVTFNKPVKKIEVTWYDVKGKIETATRSLYISDMKLVCANPIEPNKDNVNIVQDFDNNDISSCEQSILNIKISNNNCNNRIVNISQNTLPAGLEYVTDSYVGPGTPTITSTTFSLSDITVPSGQNTVLMSIAVRPTTAGSYQVQSTYNVTIASGGTGDIILSDDESGATGLQTSKLNVTAATPVTLPEITMTQSGTSCGTIDYTVTITNNTGSAVSDVIFETDLAPSQTINSISNLFGGTVEPNSYTSAGNFVISGMTLPTGVSTFTFQTQNTLNLIDPINYVSIMRDPAVDACALTNKKMAESPAKTCESCFGGKQVLENNEAMYFQGTTAFNTVINRNLAGTAPESGALNADITFNYANGATEYGANSNPRKYGKWAQLRRYDNSTTGVVTYTVNLKDGTGNSISATPSFQIAGINTNSGQADVVKIRGYCGATEVLPKLKYAYNKTAALNTAWRRYTINDATATATGVKADYENNDVSKLNVEFESKVDRVEIEWSVNRTPARKRVSNIYIGNMTFVCDNSLEPNADNVNIIASYIEDELPTCEEATMKLKVINQNCDAKEINISNSLPSDLEYVTDSYIGIGTEAPTYSGQSFSLSGLSVPSGISYLYVKVKSTDPTVPGTYATQYNYTVTGGTNNPNPYISDDESGQAGLQSSTINYLVSIALTKPVITVAVDKCYKDNASTELTYIISVQNPTATSMSVAEIFQELVASQTYVASSFVATNFHTDGTFTNDEGFVAFNEFILEGNSTATLVYKVNTNDSYDYDETDASISADGDFIKTVVSASLDPNGNCANTETITSNELIVYACTFCTINGATGTPTTNGLTGITTQVRQSGWPQNVGNGALVLESSNKGFVITRLTTAQRDAISPTLLVEGMLIYNTDANGVNNGCFQLYNGSSWKCIERSCNE